MLLCGKILNIWEVDLFEVLVLQEVYDIVVVIGVDFGLDKLEGLCYNKICIFVDVDFDGLYIVILLCVLFVKYFCFVVVVGYVFVVMLLLYWVDLGKEIFYVLDEYEKQGIIDWLVVENCRGKILVICFKGLGEMNFLQLWEIIMVFDI